MVPFHEQAACDLVNLALERRGFTVGFLVLGVALHHDAERFLDADNVRVRLGALAALYAGSICWCIGYDTIYALQDREDDALVGIRSSALALGVHVIGGVAFFYAAAVSLWALAVWLLRPDALALIALAPVALHLLWQVATLHPRDNGNALARFRANRTAGLLMALACWVVGNA